MQLKPTNWLLAAVSFSLCINASIGAAFAVNAFDNLKSSTSSYFKVSLPSKPLKPLSAGTTFTDQYSFGEQEELNAYCGKFLEKLNPTAPKADERWNDEPLRQSLFRYTIDREKFLGSCAVAKLGSEKPEDDKEADPGSYKYYLLLMHFNVPPVKATFVPFKYGFARFEAKLACSGSPDPKFTESNKLKVYKSAEILSIFPQNEILPVERQDTSEFSVTAQPSFMAASAGSVSYKKNIQDKYPYKLPRVIGSASRFGDAAWTFYPAKAQPIMLGDQATFTVLKIPAQVQQLRILANLRYQLQTLKVVTFPSYRVFDICDLDLSTAPQFDSLATTHYFSMPTDVREALIKAFGAKPQQPTKHEMIFYSDSKANNYLVDKITAEAYSIAGTGLTKLELNTANGTPGKGESKEKAPDKNKDKK